MTQPAFRTRVAGRPSVTAALFLLYGLLILGWWKGGVAWWLAFIAVIAALKTFRAYRELRRYNAWLADWRAMGTEGTAAPAPLPKQRAGRALVLLAVLLVIVLPVSFHGSTPPPGVLWLWAFACLFLAWKVLYRLWSVIRRAGGARRAVKAQSADDDAAVAWMLPPAPSSPSRAEAERNLPEYSARLLDAGIENAARPVLVRGA